MKQNGRKSLGVLLALIMVIGLLPAVTLPARAADTVLSTSGGTLSSGTYYLNANTVLTNNLTISGTVTLYLNGYVLKGNGLGAVIKISNGATLNLYDDYSSGYASAPYHSFSTMQKTIGGKSTTCYSYSASSSNQPASGAYVKGGVITGGAATVTSMNHGGGVYIRAGGRFNMYGGSIAGNYATDHGGGVAVKMNNEGGASAAFNMRGGSVRYNTSNWGGGISIYSNATVYDGTISDNIAVSGGGGVELESGGKLYMQGGTVTKNRITSMNGGLWKAGGVHVPSGSEFHIQGTVNITDNYQNTSGTTQNNVFLRKNLRITVDGPIDGSSIGVGTEAKPSGSSTVTVTTNLKSKGSSNIGVFSSDDLDYSVIWNSSKTEGILGNQGAVTFYSDMAGQRPIGSPQILKIGTPLSSVAIPADQTREGYTFAGWTTVMAGNTEQGYNYKQAMPDEGKSAEDLAEYPCILTDFTSGAVTGDMSFYPVFIKDRLNVKLVPGENAVMGNGSDGKPQSADFTVNIDEPIRMTGLLSTTRVGYDLDGWYTAKGVKWNPDGTADESTWWPMTPEYADSSTPVKHASRPYNYYTVTLTAHWTPKAVTVVYDKGEHPADTTPIPNGSVSLGGTLTLPGAPVADGNYNFTGWMIGGTLHSPGEVFAFDDWTLVTDGTGPVLNVTAQYIESKTMDIEFNTNGGTAIEPILASAGETITPPADPTKLGHTFAGWYSDPGLTIPAALPTVMPDVSATYYAKWMCNQYTLTYVLNGATNPTSIDSYTVDYDTVIQPVANPERTHYSFIGWSPEIPEKMPANDLTVEAIWEPKTYSMTFKTNDGDAGVEKTAFFGALVEPPADPTADHLSFVEWSIPLPIYMPDDNPTVTAKWKPNPTIAAETVLGKGDGKLTNVTAEMEYRPVGAAAWTPIDGTSVENLSAGVYEVRFKAAGAYKSTEITTVTVSEGTPIAVHFDANYEGAEPMADGKAVYNGLLSKQDLTEPTREEYDFAGWYKESDCTTAWDFNADTVTEEITLYAKWTKKSINTKVESLEPEEGAPDTSGVTVEGLNKVAASDPPQPGATVEVCLTVQGKADLTEKEASELTPDQQAEQNAQNAVKDLAQKETGTTTVLEFVDMGIVRTVTIGTDKTKTTIYSTGSDVLEIVIPFQTEGRYNFGVYRRHVAENGETTDKTFTKLNSRPAASFTDGMFFVGDGFIVIYATEFSTYAIGYTPTEEITPVTPVPPPVLPGQPSKAAPQTYPVTIGAVENGIVTADREKAAKNETVVITVSPDEGYELKSIKVVDAGGNEVPVTANADGSSSFLMPDSAVTVKAEFRKHRTAPEETGVADWLITDDHILYISGYPDGTVQPQGYITRAETAMIFYRLLKNKDVELTVSFPDVKDDAWYAEAVNVLGSLGIITGRTDGSFDGGAKITRAEFTAMATRFAKSTGGSSRFSDVQESYWACGNIATAAAYGWVDGYPDGTFLPQGDITRSEVAAIVNRMLGRAADKDYVSANPGTLKQFPDLQDPGAWYYADMVEATNEHAFYIADGVEKWK